MISKIKFLLFPGDKTYQEITKRNINIIFYLSIISVFTISPLILKILMDLL